MPNQRITRLLPVPLTELEVAERAQELALAELYRVQVETELAQEKSVWSERKKYLDGRVVTAGMSCARLGKIVKDHQEDRAVECEVIITGEVYSLVRTDTGEIITVRPATPGELQMDLALNAPVEKKADAPAEA